MTTRKQASIERRNQIIDAALQVFASKGFKATTNRDIAEAAGINSPGLIYHYFENQADLFRAVLQERALVLHFVQEDVEQLMTQPPRTVLTRVAEAFLDTVSEPQTLALIRLIMGEALRQRDVADMVYQSGTVHVLNFLYRYLAHWIDRGEIRPIDLGAAARCFMGPLFAYLLTTLLLELPDPRAPSREVLIDTTVETFLKGVSSA